MARCVSRLVLATLAVLFTNAASGQNYPTRAITFIVPYTPGTGIDIIARTIGPRISERWGQPVVVENKPGASGNLGAHMLAKAAPDGYTLMVNVNTFTMTPGLHKNMPYDVLTDFTPIAHTTAGYMAITVNPSVPSKSMSELISYVRSNPGKLNYGSPGVGTPHHLALELLKQQFGLDIVHIPYSGGAGNLNGLVSGQIQVSYLPLHTALPFARDDRLRILAVGSRARSALAPQQPSFSELGLEKAHIELWFGIYGPAKLPGEIVEKWNRDLPALLNAPDLKEAWLKQGLVPKYMPASEFAELTKAEVARWRAVVQKAGIKPE